MLDTGRYNKLDMSMIQRVSIQAKGVYANAMVEGQRGRFESEYSSISKFYRKTRLSHYQFFGV